MSLHQHSQHSTGSSGRSSMDQNRLDELEALHPDTAYSGTFQGGDSDANAAGLTVLEAAELPRVFKPQNTEHWIHMSRLNGVTLTDQKEGMSLSPWVGYRGGVGSDSGLGHEESGGLCRLSTARMRKDDDSLLPKPPSYWKFAILVTIINPPLGLLSLFLCYLTQRDVRRGHLFLAKRRAKQTLLLIVLAFSLSVVAVVLFVVVLTARNEYPFRLEPTVTHRWKENEHGQRLGYVPPPPPSLRPVTGRAKRPYKPPPFIPRPVEPVEDVLGDLARKWQKVNASAFDFTQHDEHIELINNLEKTGNPGGIQEQPQESSSGSTNTGHHLPFKETMDKSPNSDNSKPEATLSPNSGNPSSPDSTSNGIH